jgi:hypothetical protein
MKRIPYKDRTVHDNLVPADVNLLVAYDRDPLRAIIRLPTTLAELKITASLPSGPPGERHSPALYRWLQPDLRFTLEAGRDGADEHEQYGEVERLSELATREPCGTVQAALAALREAGTSPPACAPPSTSTQ